ncbi:hypothetical protein FQV26_10380 [Planococcus sp. CPCC 101016]|uniref:TnsD family Tn7-like transposition protein n=1 Tax=Planococcus sp. CPCC 101016 TaxID=2599617 RepID=UPI0011B35FA5|nr:TnsD family Tn7-like transposition protein [Planococcus sp. CPCC 101016]TWT08190.1 hypothetical protein FQV26_10380 [Planococcus sp. CPCC 101016]
MLFTFPTPYPDELLYSLYSRYHIRSGNTSPTMTSQNLFGNMYLRPVRDLPANLKLLTDKLGQEWDPEMLIYRNTMFNFYAPFLQKEQSSNVVKLMIGNGGNLIHSQIGFTKTLVKGKINFWICEECIKKDVELYGETYWHRVHQAHGVFTCPQHLTLLKETEIPLHSSNNRDYTPACPDLFRKEHSVNQYNDHEMEFLYKLSSMIETLFENPFSPLYEKRVKNVYLKRLHEKGYITPRGYVRYKDLNQNFNTFYGKDFLNLLQSPTSFNSSDWLKRICQKHRSSFHPIRHLLLLIFLDLDLKDLFHHRNSSSTANIYERGAYINEIETNVYFPFGKGPWPCLNMVCPSYRKNVINTISIYKDSKRKKPVGEFQCQCGFAYVRSGPDISSEDFYRIGKMKSYGKLWNDKLEELIASGNSLASICIELNVSGNTVKKFASILNIKTSWKQPLMKQDRYEDSRLLEELATKRESWLMLLMENATKSRSKLQLMAPNLHSWLKKNDKEWLESHSPPKKTTSHNRTIVDWKKRDLEILLLTKEVIRLWDSESDSITRITKTAVGKKIRKLHILTKSFDNIPLTKRYLESKIESFEVYKMRKAKFIIQQLRFSEDYYTEYQIYRKLGSSKDRVPVQVKNYIESEIYTGNGRRRKPRT